MQPLFSPPWWSRNPHIQTILPVLTKVPQLPLQRERLELDDGDFIDLDWWAAPEVGHPVLVLIHGLEGSASSHYARRMVQQCAQRGLAVVVHHHRGCSGEPNRLPRSYHSGDTADIDHTFRLLRHRYPQSPLLAVGYSLGGNVLAKYQGEQGSNSLLSRAAVVSAPLELAGCSRKLEQGFSRVYQRYLLQQLQQKMLAKIAHSPVPALPDAKTIKQLNTFYQFDDRLTGPMHGFSGAAEYYARASALPLLHKIGRPTLFIHAADDPFMSQSVIPNTSSLPACVQYELYHHGGHVGFIEGGTPWRPKFFLERRVLQYLLEKDNVDPL
ncbi:hydrolase [Shewanella yunxiaonensis]|uniref:Hydrolase n=1 Tax=Shewanella yunxiaonensis TaxID=2829809 RepID=A0ABX7YS14_9GAMM|nr:MULTISPECIES: hydrolase [Shewanella]MDF0535528.1 hydrolase [Shewanella sp. A32]QUN05303.1 hydrolase [Shewanella yunxiaonensis]